MSIKSFAAKLFAKKIAKDIKKWASHPEETQNNVFLSLIEKAKHTQFGIDHDFKSIASYDDFKSRIPVRDYEGLRPYVDKVVDGASDILWPGKPLYLLKPRALLAEQNTFQFQKNRCQPILTLPETLFCVI